MQTVVCKNTILGFFLPKVTSNIVEGKKGEDYDFDIEILMDCPDVVQYFSLSNDDYPEIRLDYMNLVFVRLPMFIKPLEECESLQDRILYSLCHAHEHSEQPERLKGNVFDRLFTVIKISNFTPMEQDDYIRRALQTINTTKSLILHTTNTMQIGLFDLLIMKSTRDNYN